MLSRSRAAGFTLVELMASASVITLLMLMLVQMSKSTADTWKNGLSKAEQFRETRRAFEIVTRRLASATLNTFWDYSYPTGIDPLNPGTTPPKGYQRQSELRFRTLQMGNVARETGFHPTHGVFFQAPSASVDGEDGFWTGAYPRKDERAPVERLDGLLNSWGYYLEVADVTQTMPTFLASGAKPQYRCRLMELREDTKNLSVFKMPINSVGDSWFLPAISDSNEATRPSHVVAENIIAMVLLPRLSSTDEATRKTNPSIGVNYQYLSPGFDYDSKKKNNYGMDTLSAAVLPNQISPYNQLPPIVQVAMFALDGNSANKLEKGAVDKKKLDLDRLTDGLFEHAEFLETRAGGKGDLAAMEQRLIDLKLNYRLFVSNVPIRGARWSASQADQ